MMVVPQLSLSLSLSLDGSFSPGSPRPYRDPVVPAEKSRYDWSLLAPTCLSDEHITVPEVRYDWMPRENIIESRDPEV